MAWIPKIFSNDSEDELTPEQKHMYASETLGNFRTIAKLCATHSSYTLTAADLASADLYVQLEELGQFALIACAILPPQFVFAKRDLLMQPGFPLEGFDALRDAMLVSDFKGAVAQVPGIVVYRKHTKQLIVGFSGTTTTKQALYDLYSVKQAHPVARRGSVHSGFWKMYDGMKAEVFEYVQKAIGEHEIVDLVAVGHSMGGALSYLFALDVLSGKCPLPSGVTVTVATFGCPRIGDAALSECWQDLVRTYQARNGEGSVKEYQVKTLNDGVPSIPPVSWGYRHLTRTPLYLYHGRLFHVPAPESEHGVFPIAQEALDATRKPDHPRGGHNYYNGTDTEKIVRRADLMTKLSKQKTADWKETYLAKIAELERGRSTG